MLRISIQLVICLALVLVIDGGKKNNKRQKIIIQNQASGGGEETKVIPVPMPYPVPVPVKKHRHIIIPHHHHEHHSQPFHHHHQHSPEHHQFHPHHHEPHHGGEQFHAAGAENQYNSGHYSDGGHHGGGGGGHNGGYDSGNSQQTDASNAWSHWQAIYNRPPPPPGLDHRPIYQQPFHEGGSGSSPVAGYPFGPTGFQGGAEAFPTGPGSSHGYPESFPAGGAGGAAGGKYSAYRGANELYDGPSSDSHAYGQKNDYRGGYYYDKPYSSGHHKYRDAGGDRYGRSRGNQRRTGALGVEPDLTAAGLSGFNQFNDMGANFGFGPLAF